MSKSGAGRSIRLEFLHKTACDSALIPWTVCFGAEITLLADVVYVPLVCNEVAAVVGSDAARTISVHVHVATPATWLTLWPASSPLPIHACDILGTADLLPVVFAVSVAAVTGRHVLQVITRSQHLVFVRSWPVHGAHNVLIEVESAAQSKHFGDRRVG